MFSTDEPLRRSLSGVTVCAICLIFWPAHDVHEDCLLELGLGLMPGRSGWAACPPSSLVVIEFLNEVRCCDFRMMWLPPKGRMGAYRKLHSFLSKRVRVVGSQCSRIKVTSIPSVHG
jgi:hypothetical protein